MFLVITTVMLPDVILPCIDPVGSEYVNTTALLCRVSSTFPVRPVLSTDRQHVPMKRTAHRFGYVFNFLYQLQFTKSQQYAIASQPLNVDIVQHVSAVYVAGRLGTTARTGNNRPDAYSRRDAKFCVSSKILRPYKDWPGRQWVTAGDAWNTQKRTMKSLLLPSRRNSG